MHLMDAPPSNCPNCNGEREWDGIQDDKIGIWCPHCGMKVTQTLSHGIARRKPSPCPRCTSDREWTVRDGQYTIVCSVCGYTTTTSEGEYTRATMLREITCDIENGINAAISLISLSNHPCSNDMRIQLRRYADSVWQTLNTIAYDLEIQTEDSINEKNANEESVE